MSEKLDRNIWITASATRNWILKDPLLDWLEIMMPDQKNPNEQRGLEFLMRRGIAYEADVIDRLRREFPNQVMQVAHAHWQAEELSAFEQTKKWMREGVGIIYQGVVRSSQLRAYGIPDLIVRHDILQEITSVGNLPKLHTRTDDIPTYFIIDIKSCTLLLTADHEHLLNVNSMPAYKAQLYVYQQALDEMQEFVTDQALVMGTAWRGPRGASGERASRLGLIDYQTTDQQYTESVLQALEWNRRVRAHAREWNTSPVPSVSELYPNMCNTHDTPWHTYKENLARELGEITAVWHVSYAARQTAHAQGVLSWRDPRCTAALLGFIPSSDKYRIIDKILKFNQNVEAPKVSITDAIDENYQNWQNMTREFSPAHPPSEPNILHVYMDMETISAAFYSLPKGRNNFVCVLGCYMWGRGRETATWNSLYAPTPTEEDEKSIFQAFLQLIKASRAMDTTKVNIYVWGDFEATVFAEVRKAYPREEFSCSSLIKDRFINFIEIMQSEPLLVRGALNFKLKEVARAMLACGLIKTSYQDDPVATGWDAMTMLARAYKPLTDIAEKEHILDAVREYNKKDCLIMKQIIDFWRDRSANERFLTAILAESKCCICHEFCNPSSQICGRCARGGPPTIKRARTSEIPSDEPPSKRLRSNAPISSEDD